MSTTVTLTSPCEKRCLWYSQTGLAQCYTRLHRVSCRHARMRGYTDKRQHDKDIEEMSVRVRVRKKGCGETCRVTGRPSCLISNSIQSRCSLSPGSWRLDGASTTSGGNMSAKSPAPLPHLRDLLPTVRHLQIHKRGHIVLQTKLTVLLTTISRDIRISLFRIA